MDEIGTGGARTGGRRARPRAWTVAWTAVALAAGLSAVLTLLDEYAGLPFPAPVRWTLIGVQVVAAVTGLVLDRRGRRA